MSRSVLRLSYGILEGAGVRNLEESRPPDSKSGLPSTTLKTCLSPSPLFKSDGPHSKPDCHLLCNPRQPIPGPPFPPLSNRKTAPLRGKTSRSTDLPHTPQMPNDQVSLHVYWHVPSANGLIF